MNYPLNFPAYLREKVKRLFCYASCFVGLGAAYMNPGWPRRVEKGMKVHAKDQVNTGSTELGQF